MITLKVIPQEGKEKPRTFTKRSPEYLSYIDYLEDKYQDAAVERGIITEGHSRSLGFNAFLDEARHKEF